MIISGSVGKRVPDGGGMVLRLTDRIAGKSLAVVNHNTIGAQKLHTWKTGDYFSMEVECDIGPDAIFVEKIY